MSDVEEKEEGELDLEKYVSEGMEKTINHFSDLVNELGKDDDCNPITIYVALSVFKKLFADMLIRSKLLDSKQIGTLGVISNRLATEMYQQFVKDIT